MSDFEKRVDAYCLAWGITKEMRMRDNLKVMLHLLDINPFIKEGMIRVLKLLELI